MSSGSFLRSLFLVDGGGVSRLRFLVVGVLAFALKWAGDFALTATLAEKPLSPLAYFNPLLSARLADVGEHSTWLLVLLGAFSLPFIWLGVVMCARRAADAGASPWLALLFFLPVINWLIIAWLCVAPTASAPDRSHTALEPVRARLSAVVKALAVSSGVGLLFVVISVFGAEKYSAALFVGAPFLIGMLAAQALNRAAPTTVGATLSTAVLAITIVGGALLLLALEGVVCLAMAAVLAYPLAVLGALFGRAIATSKAEPWATRSLLVLAPGLGFAPLEVSIEGTRQVSTSVEVDAPPERVFPNVVGFADLPPPEHWLFATGIAYPVRARIEGHGVGAVRRCEFSTGAFVEPITAWEEPRRLAFDVTSEPPSMHEWSPYATVHAPHLTGGMHSVRGQFVLEPLPGGRTRLTGTTWYELRLDPGAYWAPLTDFIVHRIHSRVLAHVARLSEGPSGDPQRRMLVPDPERP